MAEYKNRIIGSGVEPLDAILFNPRNWRVHPLNQQNALKGVLEEVGWVQEVIINQRTGHLVDGHLRCQLAAREGAKTIPVKYVDLSEEEEALVLSTLDPIAAMATTDKAKLDELFASIETENADVLKMLDDIAEKERLEYAKRDPVDAEPQIDRAAELNEKWQVVTGDLWQIGEHRLLCGDSTKREDVERVMAGEKADMVFTDPPYGVGRDIENDDLTGKDFDAFNSGWLSVIPSAVNCGMVCYHSTRTFPSVLREAVITGWKFERMLWYYRPDKFPTNSWKHWMMVSQAIMLFSLGNVEYADTESDQDCYRLTSSGLGDGHSHPTEKMTEHCQRVMSHYNANKVYEPFCGSGTTMVACQNLNRKCRAIEISPNYCAVIIERMHTAFPELEIKKLA